MTTLPLPPIAAVTPPEREGAVHKLGWLTLMMFLFLFFSRLADVWLFYLHLPLVLSLLALTTAALSGGLVDSLKTRTALFSGILMAWMLLGVPFSVWRGGSLSLILNGWLRAAAVCLLVVALTTRIKEVIGVMNAIALGVLGAALFGLREGTGQEGSRLLVEGTRFANPNDLAFILLLGLPFWLRYCASGRRNKAGRCLGAGAVMLILVSFLKTGSRGGMIGLVAMAVVLFWRVSVAGKAKLAVASALLVVVAYMVLPPYLRERYFTFESTEASAADPGLRAAAQSTTARRQHLVDSLKMTLRNPVFGVGAGNFPIAQAELDQKAGVRSSWLGTHNAYTQISSECGIPALIFFVVLLVHGLRSAQGAWRLMQGGSTPLAAEIRKAALAGEASMWGMCVFIFFAHLGYDTTVYLMVGVMAAISRATRKEAELATAAPAPNARPSIPAGKPWKRRIACSGA